MVSRRAVRVSIVAIATVVAVALLVKVGAWRSSGPPVAAPLADVAARSSAKLDASAAVSSTASAPNLAPLAALRAEFLVSADLMALYDRLMASDAPGARLYASFARLECAMLRMNFGDGADAWAKFNAIVGEAAADRSARVALFERMQERCRGFGTAGTPLSAGMSALRAALVDLGDDAYARSLAVLTRAGVNSSRETPAAIQAAALVALESGDPDLLAALSSHWRFPLPDAGRGLRMDEAAFAVQGAWNMAIEALTGQVPLTVLQSQQANCIVGRGCDAASARTALERRLFDRPDERRRQILAAADALAPHIEMALRHRKPPATSVRVQSGK